MSKLENQWRQAGFTEDLIKISLGTGIVQFCSVSWQGLVKNPVRRFSVVKAGGQNGK